MIVSSKLEVCSVFGSPPSAQIWNFYQILILFYEVQLWVLEKF